MDAGGKDRQAYQPGYQQSPYTNRFSHTIRTLQVDTMVSFRPCRDFDTAIDIGSFGIDGFLRIVGDCRFARFFDRVDGYGVPVISYHAVTAELGLCILAFFYPGSTVSRCITTLLIRKMTDKDFVVTDAFVVFLDSSHAGMESVQGGSGKFGCTKFTCFLIRYFIQFIM